MLSSSSSPDLVSNFSCLTSKTNYEEAMRLLKKVATMVRPIMKAHNWKVTHLDEFYTKGLLGMNTNRGWKIQLCLRSHHDESLFLPWEDILGTMLHELAHNIRGPHDQIFYKALDDLNDEYDKIIASGYTGEGFDSVGQRLGTRHGGFGPGGMRLGGAHGASVVSNEIKTAAVLAAEKRRQVNEMMLPAGGRRLGGGTTTGGRRGETPSGFWEQWHSPGELAAVAAERRAKDQKWCGSSSSPGSSLNPKTLPTIPSSSTINKEPVPKSRSSAHTDNNNAINNHSSNTMISQQTAINIKRRGSDSTAVLIPTTQKKARNNPDLETIPAWQLAQSIGSSPIIAPLTQPVSNQWPEWTCLLCTLVNRPLALQCECCLTHRPSER